MKVKTIEKGKSYYFSKDIKRMLCIEVGTSKNKLQSDFTDYKNILYRFYDHDMHIDRYKS